MLEGRGVTSTKRGSGRRRVPPVLSLLLLSLGAALAGPVLATDLAAGEEPYLGSRPAALQPVDGERIDGRRWLEEIQLLISDAERARFLSLGGNGERETFIHLFWQRRDPTPFTPENELRRRWTERLGQARQWASRAGIADLSDPRAEAILLLGEPRRIFELPCTKPWGDFPIQPLEVWYYPSKSYRGPANAVTYLIFLLPDSLFPVNSGEDASLRHVRHWAPTEGVSGLLFPRYRSRFNTDFVTLRSIAESVDRGLCYRRHQAEFEALERALGEALSREQIEEIAQLSTWLGAGTSTDLGELPIAAASLPAKVRIAYPGLRGDETVAEFRLDLERAPLASLPGQDPLQHLAISGEFVAASVPHSHFLFRAYLSRLRPWDDDLESPLSFLFHRTLPPGHYTLALSVEELESGRRFRDLFELHVPDLRLAPPGDRLPPPAGPRRATLLSEARPALVLRRESLEILPPPDGLHLGPLEVQAMVTGEKIATVRWQLNGEPVTSLQTPPFTAQLDLGRQPRPHRVSATALSIDDRALAHDFIEINAGPHQFRVQLIEPQPGGSYPVSAPARVRLDLPPGAQLDRVDFYLDDELVATSRTPPFLVAIPVVQPGQIGTIRAVARLSDGRSADDGLLINSGTANEEVEVDLVEIFLSASEGLDRPVRDLEASDFAVYEDGIRQSISRFERVENLPLHAAVLMDTSQSMQGRLGRATSAARRFFDTVVTHKDRAALLTFNQAHELVVPFTDDVAQLDAGLEELRPSGSTALFDSLATALYYFGGLEGKRALILLTDGAEENSLIGYGGVLDYARRAGVAIYPIALRSQGKFGRTSGGRMAKSSPSLLTRLKALAQQTGGRAYTIDTVEELDPIYTAIERELRSQYLIAYQSSQGSSGPDFRSVRVEVLRPGVSAQTQRGYYAD